METPKDLPDKMQMIDGNGEFSSTKTEEFMKELKKSSSTSSHCTVISIIGRQSSGKSYLLNSLFGTKFEVLDASKGWKQTTKGIWIAKCITPRVIIMDVEGYEGKEREEDTLFERQSALFSLTVSDVMLLNMNHVDINRARPPLLELIFQERVKMDPNKQLASKTTLIICLRNYEYETPLELTEETLEKSMIELWYKVHPATTNRKMSDYIQVIVKAFPHKKEKEIFNEKSKDLAELLWQFCTDGSQQHSHHASTFALGSQKIWDLIRKNKQISFADHKLAMSTHVCEESKKDILGSFAELEEYKSLTSDEFMPVKEFNQKLQIFLTTITKRYEGQTTATDRVKREQVKENLVKKTLKIFQPKFEQKIDSLCSDILSKAKSEIWDELEKISVLDASTITGVIRPYMAIFNKNSRPAMSEIGDQLKKIAVLDASTITGVIRPYMAIFNENSRPDLQEPHFKKILQEKQKFFAEKLIEVAEEAAENVEIKRIVKTAGTVAGLMTIATASGLITGVVPSLVITGVITSSRDIYKTAKRASNKKDRRIRVDDIIDKS